MASKDKPKTSAASVALPSPSATCPYSVRLR